MTPCPHSFCRVSVPLASQRDDTRAVTTRCAPSEIRHLTITAPRIILSNNTDLSFLPPATLLELIRQQRNSSLTISRISNTGYAIDTTYTRPLWGRMFLLYMTILECYLVCGLNRYVWILDRAECDNRGSQCYQVGEERRHISCNVYWKRIRASRMHQEACLLSKSGRKERRALKQRPHERLSGGKKIVSQICFNSLVLHPGKFLPIFPSHPLPSFPFPFHPIPFHSLQSFEIPVDRYQPNLTSSPPCPSASPQSHWIPEHSLYSHNVRWRYTNRYHCTCNFKSAHSLTG